MRSLATRPLLVGELNPYGGSDDCALYPLPPEASGGRLQRHLGLQMTEYLRLFDRANLCRGAWDLRAARSRANALLHAAPPALVLLGSKVCQAFGVPFIAFSSDEAGGIPAAVLPHPSGRNLLWNAPDASAKALAALRRVGVDVEAWRAARRSERQEE